MKFKSNRKAFLKSLPLGRMNGQQKFLSLVVWISKGKTSKKISLSEIRENWYKTEMVAQYNPSFYARAQEENWVEPNKTSGILKVRKEGLEYLEALANNTIPGDPLNDAGHLIVFEDKSAHTFDKFLRNIFAGAQKNVLIADSYVDETIFDNLIDLIPSTVKIQLLYKKKQGSFDNRIKRFKIEYSKFETKKNEKLHDRFVVVDDNGYIIGPSLKDAANKSPSTVVMLSKTDAEKLKKLFRYMWT